MVLQWNWQLSLNIKKEYLISTSRAKPLILNRIDSLRLVISARCLCHCECSCFPHDWWYFHCSCCHHCSCCLCHVIVSACVTVTTHFVVTAHHVACFEIVSAAAAVIETAMHLKMWYCRHWDCSAVWILACFDMWGANGNHPMVLSMTPHYKCIATAWRHDAGHWQSLSFLRMYNIRSFDGHLFLYSAASVV